MSEPLPKLPFHQVRVDQLKAERDYWERERQKAAEQHQREASDPFDYGHWSDPR